MGNMKSAFLILAAASLAFSARPAGSPDSTALKNDLKALRSGPSTTAVLLNKVAVDINAVAVNNQLSPEHLQSFTQALVGSLSGHSLEETVIDGIAGDIQQVLESSSTNRVNFEQVAQDFEKQLMRGGVPQATAHQISLALESLVSEPSARPQLPARKPATPRP
jgi:hypothetical protein